MIIVLGQVQVDPADVNEFRRDIHEIDPSRRTESGCIFYSTAMADPTAGRMLVVERWQDKESLAAHIQGKAVSDFVRKWSGRMRGDVRKYDAANERPLLDQCKSPSADMPRDNAGMILLTVPAIGDFLDDDHSLE